MSDPALVVGVADLLRRPGTRRAERFPVVLDGLAISTARVPDGADLEVDLVLESQSASIVVAGTVAAPWVGPCRRCLEDASGTARAEVREIFENRPTEGETYPLHGEQIDLEPLVRDAVLLALPLAPLCSEDCRGPAPGSAVVGTSDDPATVADDDDEVAGLPADPRWAALDELRFE